MERLDKLSLTMDDQFLLENKVLPTWKRWMNDYPFSSPLFDRGLDGVLKWGAENDNDVASRYREYKRSESARFGEC